MVVEAIGGRSDSPLVPVRAGVVPGVGPRASVCAGPRAGRRVGRRSRGLSRAGPSCRPRSISRVVRAPSSDLLVARLTCWSSGERRTIMAQSVVLAGLVHAGCPSQASGGCQSSRRALGAADDGPPGNLGDEAPKAVGRDGRTRIRSHDRSRPAARGPSARGPSARIAEPARWCVPAPVGATERPRGAMIPARSVRGGTHVKRSQR